MQKRDFGRHAVAFDDFFGFFDDGGHVDADDVFGAGFDGEPGFKGIGSVFVLSIFCFGGLWVGGGRYEGASMWGEGQGERDGGISHAEDSGTASDVEDNLVLEQVRVLVDRVAVRFRSDFIFLYSRSKISDGGISSIKTGSRGQEPRNEGIGSTHQHLLMDTFKTSALVFISVKQVEDFEFGTDHDGCNCVPEKQ